MCCLPYAPPPSSLVQLLVEKFLFPASVLMQLLSKEPGNGLCTHAHLSLLLPAVRGSVSAGSGSCHRVFCRQLTKAYRAKPSYRCDWFCNVSALD